MTSLPSCPRIHRLPAVLALVAMLTATRGAAAADEPVEEERPARKLFWVGLSVEGDLAFTPRSDDACQFEPTSNAGYACRATTELGADVDTPRASRDPQSYSRATVGAGVTTANTRYLLTFDYSLSEHALIGARVGFVAATYPGERVAAFGRLHLEARATYVFGERPLTTAGIAPSLLVAAGAAEMSARAIADDRYFASGVPAPNSSYVAAWRVSGPFFASVGLGLRVAASSSAAILVYPIKTTLSLGGTGSTLALSPEIGAQIGF